MDKSPDAFRSIGEVSRLVGVAPHVLRYWETQFSHLSPVKRGDGRRYYRPDDIRLVAGLCQVMREEGLSIRGAKRLISVDRGAGLRQIGAARLAEMVGELPPVPQDGSAPEASVPDTAEVEIPAEATPMRQGKFRAGRRAQRRQGATAGGPGLPLFPEAEVGEGQDLLSRLCAAARGLRRLEFDKASLPPEAAQLREHLRSHL